MKNIVLNSAHLYLGLLGKYEEVKQAIASGTTPTISLVLKKRIFSEPSQTYVTSNEREQKLLSYQVGMIT